MKTRGLILLVTLACGCVTSSQVEPKPTTRLSTTMPHYEYGEVRWEVGGGTRNVWLERPGDQFKGVWFEDALDYATLPRPMPSNTQKATSSDLLTALSTEGWQVVAHAMSDPREDLHVEVWTIRRRAQPGS